jgi:hypothetical protein
MDFHGINSVGKVYLERLNSKPIFVSQWIGRIIFALDTQTLSIGTSAGWIDIVSATDGGLTNPTIPIGETILFEKDTAVFGYTLKIDFDDGVIYITKGSGAGGEAGGSNKAGGTWTQNHYHATRNHTLTIAEMPSHDHPPKAGVANFMSSTGSTHGEGGDSYGVHGTTGLRGGDQPHNHGNTENATGSSWRPKGKNYTRQTKI